MAQYRHGVYIQEQATSIATPAQANSALPVFVGVAPVHNLTDSSAAPVNEPKLIYTFSEFVSTFGAPGDDEKRKIFLFTRLLKSTLAAMVWPLLSSSTSSTLPNIRAKTA